MASHSGDGALLMFGAQGAVSRGGGILAPPAAAVWAPDSVAQSAAGSSAMLTRTLTAILSGVCLLAAVTVAVGSAACVKPMSLNDGKKEENISRIMDSGRCLRGEQHDRVGKWFCYVQNMVGIQTDEQTKQVSSGRIKPAAEKFFVTISETSEETKKYVCDLGEYGVDPNDPQSNDCLANFNIEFSPPMGFFHDSVDTYHFYDADDSFTLYGGPAGNTFVMFRSGEGNSYVSHGKCEKIN